MGTYVKINLNRPTEASAGSGSGKNEVVIVAADDASLYPPRDGKGVKMVGNFVMVSGTKMSRIYTTKSKGEAPVTGEGEEDSQSLKHEFNCQHPGNRLEVKEFVQNWLGVPCYILHKSCQDDYYEVMGTPCAPLQLVPSKTDNNDARFWALKFSAFAKTGLVPGHYEGEIILDAPFDVTDATEIPLETGHGVQYKLPATSSATSAAIDTLTLEHGTYVTLIGSGGTTPTTLANGGTGIVVALKSGTSWTALNGAVIQFQVFVAGATKYLFELSRG